jgi:hypothetical protein
MRPGDSQKSAGASRGVSQKSLLLAGSRFTGEPIRCGCGGLEVRNGSVEHRDLVCREFINGFKSYEVSDRQWPELDRLSASRIRAMPFWNDALRAEQIAAGCARRMAEAESDHALREALAMLAYEKGRAASLIESLMHRYGIKIQRLRGDRRRSPEWGYMWNGFTELNDMLLAFGLFRLGAQAQFLPATLITIFEDLMAEEARHVMLFHNWTILRMRRAPFHLRPMVMIRGVAGLSLTTFGRLRAGMRVALSRPFKEPAGHFVMWAPSRLLGNAVSFRRFIEIGIGEFDRRMATFDPSLPRPWLAPAMLRWATHLLPDAEQRRPSGERRTRHADRRPVTVMRGAPQPQPVRYRRPV